VSDVSSRVSGTAPGQRRLNGPQTSGREYRNLSEPTHAFVRDDDDEVPMRDGTRLLAGPLLYGCAPARREQSRGW
jgi:hypothetical protein